MPSRPRQEAAGRCPPSRGKWLALLFPLCLLWLAFVDHGRAHAQVALGAHTGLNLDHGHIHLGVDALVPLAQLSPSVRLDLRPSFANVFLPNADDVRLLGADLPFEFAIDGSIVTPYAAPGLGLAIGHDVWLKLNLIGGAFFDVGSDVRLFSEIAIRLVNGTFVDLLAGALFVL